MPQLRLLPLASEWSFRFTHYVRSPQALAMPYLRPAILRSARCIPVRLLRSLLEVRKFWSHANLSRPGRAGNSDLPEALARYSRLPLRSVQAAIFQRSPFSSNRGLDEPIC